MKITPPLAALTLAFTAFAQGQVLIDFDTAADYDNNFRETTGGSLLGFNASVPSVRYSQNGNTLPAVTVYDTTPGDGTSTVNVFGDASLRINFQLSQPSDSIGILARLDGTGTGYMAIVNLATTTGNNVLRIFDGATTAGAAGSSVAGVTATSGNLLVAGTYYSLEFTTINSGGSVQLNANLFTLDNFGGTPLYTASYLDSTSPFSAAGEAGVRFGKANSVGQSNTDLTMFSVVPEPSSGFLLGLAGVALLGYRRRAYRNI